MFHLAVGVKRNDDSVNGIARSYLRDWESCFTSDPYVYKSRSSSDRNSDSKEFLEIFGEVRLFRDYAGLLEGVPFDILPVQRGCRVLVIGVPCSVSIDALIGDRLDDIKHYSVLRRSVSEDSLDFDRSLFLLFYDQKRADAFYRDWHLQYFSGCSGPVCYLLFVDKLHVDFVDSSGFRDFLPLGSQQVPSCPFCIERIDVNISGVITSRRGWLSANSMASRSSACIVCAKQAQDTSPSCMICGASSSSASVPLWLCLLCGHVGCGRYAKGDAWGHFHSSGHRLSLELDSGRIWDYHSDQFVHRRIARGEGILDLPERIDSSTLPVHPQVCFEEDIRELDETMIKQLDHERSKYEEACTQLRILGLSRLQEEEELLEKERQQETTVRDQIKTTTNKIAELQTSIAACSKQVARLEKSINSLQGRKHVLETKLAKILAEPKPTIPEPKLKELHRLEAEAATLRLAVSNLFT